MAKVKLTDIFNQELALDVDRMDCWTLSDGDGNEVYLQSDSEKDSWAEMLIVKNHRWFSVANYLKRHNLSDSDSVRISSDDWGMAIGTL